MDYYFISGGDWINNQWYGIMYDTFGKPCPLVIIDTKTGAVDTIGYSQPMITGFAYDYSSGLAYILGFGGELGTIDLETGEVTDIGISGVYQASALACNLEGQLYAISNDGYLYIIDKTTAASEVVGGLGFSYVGEAGLSFDRNTNTLYGLIPSFIPPEKGSFEININTGSTTQVCALPYNFGGLSIPYEDTTTTYNLGVYNMTPPLQQME